MIHHQDASTKRDILQPRKDSDQDEQIVCYYDALLQAIREGREDPDLLSEEDLLAAFSEEYMEDGQYNRSNLDNERPYLDRETIPTVYPEA